MAERDFLINDEGRLVLRAGGVATGESLTQEVALILATCQGEWRHDPLLGCNLVKRMNAPLNKVDLERTIRIQLERDGKPWDTIKDGIKTSVNNG